MHQTLKATNDL